MAHLHIIEDKNKQAVDQKVYCSDYYKGWFGCMEVQTSQKCERQYCENIVKGIE